MIMLFLTFMFILSASSVLVISGYLVLSKRKFNEIQNDITAGLVSTLIILSAILAVCHTYFYL